MGIEEVSKSKCNYMASNEKPLVESRVMTGLRNDKLNEWK